MQNLWIQDVNGCDNDGSKHCHDETTCQDIAAVQSRRWRVDKGIQIRFNCTACKDGYKQTATSGKFYHLLVALS